MRRSSSPFGGGASTATAKEVNRKSLSIQSVQRKKTESGIALLHPNSFVFVRASVRKQELFVFVRSEQHMSKS